MLITYGTLLRKSAFVAAGGLDHFAIKRIRNGKKTGKWYFVIGDPNIKVFPTKSNGLLELMERYSRWYMDINDKPSIRGYLHNITQFSANDRRRYKGR